MAHPLMPKATAVWLVENTALTFDQIAAFCGLHELEVQAIADDDVAVGMQGLDPIAAGVLTADEIERCAKDPNARLEMAKPTIPQPKARTKGARYTPVAKRQDRPDAIAWLLRNHPELTDAQVSKLIGTTKPTINAIRERTHWNMTNIKPQNPIGLGLCAAAELERVVNIARARAKTVHESKARPIEGDTPVADAEPGAIPGALPGAAAGPDTAADASPGTQPEAAPPAPEPTPEPTPEPAPEPHGGLPATQPNDALPATPEVLKEAENVFGPAPTAPETDTAPTAPETDTAPTAPETPPADGADAEKPE